MNKPIIRTLHAVAAFVVASAMSLPAIAATPLKSMSKPPAPGCAGKFFVDPGQNSKSGHRYMLMMVFKAGTGGKYFGDADFGTAGCIGDIESTKQDAAAGIRTTDEYVLKAEVCPTNCTEPEDNPPLTDAATMTASKDIEKGSDPLGNYNFGILSVVAQPMHTPVADNKFEIWQVVVRDACQARDLYDHYAAEGQLLARAKDAGEYLGQMMIGIRTRKNGSTEACK